MPGFHAGWSLGTVAGAGFGALAAHADLDPSAHFALASLVLAVAAPGRPSARCPTRTRADDHVAPRASTTCPARRRR